MPKRISAGGIGILGTFDLTKFDGDQVVVHFGGSVASVDAYTFANSLIAFADTVRAINAVVNPGQDIEIRLEAQGPGSYRAVVRRLKKGIGGFFSRGAETLFWSLVAALILDHFVGTKPEVVVTVDKDEVIIQDGGDRIIVPRNVYDALPNVRKSPEVQKNLSRTFRAIEQDEAVTDFGLTAKLNDPEPILVIPRDKFHEIAYDAAVLDSTEKMRPREVEARLVILKAWLTHAKRKWSFEWNGVPLSAPIKDEGFLDKIDRREYLIGAGDALDVFLQFRQVWDESLGVYVNDPNSFVVTKVIKPVPRSAQTKFPS
jgi:hypothetical protein